MQDNREQSDPLDDLLARARWPEPTAQSTRRLRRQWASMRQSAAAFWWPRVAVAAVVLAAAAIWSEIPSSTGPVRLRPQAQAIPVVMGRPPTELELAMLRTIPPLAKGMRRVEPRGVPLIPLVSGWGVSVPVTPVTAPAPPADLRRTQGALGYLVALGPDRSEKTVFDLLADPGTAEPAIAAVCRQAGEWTDALFAAFNDPRTAVRQSAEQALARIDGPAITARLAMMAEQGINRREAVAALVRIHNTQARRFVAAAAESRNLASIVRSALVQYQTGVIQ